MNDVNGKTPDLSALFEKQANETQDEFGVRKEMKLVIEGDRRMAEVWDAICTLSAAIVKNRRTYALLRGDPGTGKGASARAVQKLTRKKLLTVNCGEISKALAESQLFGHERGTFTGADKRKEGYFEQTGGDILFLDELDSLPLATQQKVLSVTEEPHIFRLVGGTDELVFRGHMIAAVSHEVREGLGSAFESRFDYDIRLPSLAERSQENQVRLFDMLARAGGITIAPDLRDGILRGTHNGNIRNLAKLIRRLADRAARLQTDKVTKEMITWAIEFGTKKATNSGDNILVGELPDGSLAEVTSKIVAIVEKRKIEQALRKTRGHVGKAAEVLQLSRRSVTDKIALYQIDKKQFKDGGDLVEEEDDD